MLIGYIKEYLERHQNILVSFSGGSPDGNAIAGHLESVDISEDRSGIRFKFRPYPNTTSTLQLSVDVAFSAEEIKEFSVDENQRLEITVDTQFEERLVISMVPLNADDNGMVKLAGNLLRKVFVPNPNLKPNGTMGPGTAMPGGVHRAPVMPGGMPTGVPGRTDPRPKFNN